MIMIRAELILDTRVKSKKGYPVKIRVYDDMSKKHKYIALKIYQDNTELKLDSFLRKKSSDLDEQINFCNENLYSIEESINVIKEGVPLDDIDIEIELLEKRLELLRAKKGSKNGIGFIAFTKNLIKEREVLKRPTNSYTSIINAVSKFISPLDDIPINNITNEWIKKFDLFYKDLDSKDSTIQTYIKFIKTIFTEAQSRESLHIKKDNPFVKLRSFKKSKTETQLRIDDLISMYKLGLSDIKTQSKFGNEHIKRIIDIYLFQFAIGGHDLIDVANLKWHNIQNGRVVFKRYKNRFKKSEGEEISNKLCEFALSIIANYGDKTSKRLFSFLPDPEKDIVNYRYYNNTLNISTFKVVRKLIESENNFTSKSTRYLFRTTAGNLLINDLIIMKIQGHTPQGITFGYQGAINHEVQDKEHQKILDLVFKEETAN